LTPTINTVAAAAASPSISLAGNKNLYALTATTTKADSATQVAGPANFVTIKNNTTTGASPVGSVSFTVTGSTVYNSTATTGVLTSLAGTGSEVQIATPTAGTITVTGYAYSGASGTYSATATDTVTITVSSVVVGVVSAGNSTSILSTTTATPFVGTTDATISAINTANARAATVRVILKDTQSTPAVIGSKSLTATVTGSGLVGGSTGTGAADTYTDATVTGTLGRSITVNTDALGQAFFGIFADGSSGTGTITVTQGTTVISTETVTFYGAVASFKATAKKNVAGTGAVTTAALDVVAYDANSVVVPSQAITLTSGTTATIASFTETTSTAAEVAAGTAAVDVIGVSGKSGAVVLTIKDTATGLISTTVTVNVGLVQAKTVTVALDSASYNAGDLVTMTITALDSSGSPVADSTGTANSLAITTNGAVQGTLPTASAFKLGKQTVTFYAPLVSTDFKANVKLVGVGGLLEWATALNDTTIVATASVNGDSTAALALDAANAATDAANNAYDEAQNATQAASDALAAVTALAAQVKTLIASVKALTAAVAKLKKK
jgi:hypothetical protein